MQDFSRPIAKKTIDIVDKTRSNLFSWRGQFSPQLVEAILESYCLPNSIILDPFVGSGTVLMEAGKLGFKAYGFEINPAAFIFSRIFEFINDDQREKNIDWVRTKLDFKFPNRLFNNDTKITNLEKIKEINSELDCDSRKILEALIVLLDFGKNKVTNELLQSKFDRLVDIVTNLPLSNSKIKVGLSDARSLPLENSQIDFVLTSPPYINVFNYHQNYRKSVEILGWNLLQIAKSEIGSNRANRGNRFYTVVQYCLDIADTLLEIARVTKTNGRIVLIVGYQSNVLGVPFYNADIIEQVGVKSGLFTQVLRQKREFKNRFGKIIREDIINLVNLDTFSQNEDKEKLDRIAREVALNALQSNLGKVSLKNLQHLKIAIDKVYCIERTRKLAKDRLIYASPIKI